MQTRLRSKVTLLFMMLGLLLAVPTLAFAAQKLSVDATQDLPGQETDIFIHEGDLVVIKAHGLVDLDCNTENFNNVRPDGIDGARSANAVLPSANFGALLGSIGEFSNTNGGFLVGSGTSFTASKSGELHLIVNDTVGGFTDNYCGHFTAKIRVKEPRT